MIGLWIVFSVPFLLVIGSHINWIAILCQISFHFCLQLSPHLLILVAAIGVIFWVN